MYPHGPEHGDEALAISGYLYLYLCKKIETPSLGFPFYGERHYKLYVGIAYHLNFNMRFLSVEVNLTDLRFNTEVELSTSTDSLIALT